jgi:hypothetical protein
MDKNKKRIQWITRTGLFVALLLVIQVATKPFNITLLTGSLVNVILIISVMTCGFSSGLIVAILSPIFAMLLGIGPLWLLIPFISLGNLTLIVLWYLISHRVFKDRFAGYFAALVLGAAGKFLVLYLTVVRLMVPLLNLPAKQAGGISAAFSISQLFTALIGGAVAIMVLPILKKAIFTKE